MTSIDDEWDVFCRKTGKWRPAKIINELGNQVELQFLDTLGVPDLEKTISATRQAMSNEATFRSKLKNHKI